MSRAPPGKTARLNRILMPGRMLGITHVKHRSP